MDATRVRILSVGTALPGPPVDTPTLTRCLGVDPDRSGWIDATLGTRTRHLSVDLTGTGGHTSLTDLVATAAQRAMTTAEVAPADIDAILLSTGAPDQLMPATVNLVADRLRIDGIPTYQLQAGATGAIAAIEMAGQLLATGRHRTVLVAAGDTSEKQLDRSGALAGASDDELLDAATFGDAAGAAVLTAVDRPAVMTVHSVLHRRARPGRASGHRADWLGTAARRAGRQTVTYDRDTITATVPEVAAEVLADLLHGLGWRPEDLARLLPPQLWGRLADTVVSRLHVPAQRCDSRVADTGNAANSLPLLQLSAALARTGPGDRVAGVVVDPSGWVAAALAVQHD